MVNKTAHSIPSSSKFEYKIQKLNWKTQCKLNLALKIQKLPLNYVAGSRILSSLTKPFPSLP